jgi:hypothetical protein
MTFGDVHAVFERDFDKNALLHSVLYRTGIVFGSKIGL